jgi:hypothetical protein
MSVFSCPHCIATLMDACILTFASGLPEYWRMGVLNWSRRVRVSLLTTGKSAGCCTSSAHSNSRPKH